MTQSVDVPLWGWVLFNSLLVVMLLLDLLVFHRNPHRVSVKEAILTSAGWIAVALVFNVFLYWRMGPEAGITFLTGYLIEKALSVDNLFVFAAIFAHFRVPAESQHRLLFWGVVGALLMRGTMIIAGAELLARAHWIFYVFGALLIYTGIKMARPNKEVEVNPSRNPVVRWARRIMRVTDDYEESKFFVRRNGLLYATPLFVVLLMVETTDLVFAVDSIPAIFAITLDPFIVYTSNALAILGLRALFFVLAHVINSFRYLGTGLALVLVFIGAKMLLVEVVHVPVAVSLAVVAGVLAVAVGMSILLPQPQPQPQPQPSRQSWEA
ncbi:MAG: TerC family protein [Firmicutes bacterium]|nr:TerC family protein [Bacillota bacterium]